MKLVAVIVNYNAGTLLEKSVSAALAADPPMRVVVVDNNSSDASLSGIEPLAAAEPRLCIERNDENLGFARANNQVIRSNEADYYVLVNPDCIIESTTVATIVEAMEKDTDIGLASCTIRNADGTIQKTCRRDFPTPWTGLVRILGLRRIFRMRGLGGDFDKGTESSGTRAAEYVEAISGAFMVARGSAVREIGLLDEGYFMHCEDLDWCMRFWLKGHKVAFVPRATVVHHKGGSGRSVRVVWHLHKGMLRFYRKFYLERYPRPVSWLVYAGVITRFIIQSALVTVSSLWRKLVGGGPRERAFG